MSPSFDESLADILARREAEAGEDAGGWVELDDSLREGLESCSALERDLCAIALAGRGHPERAGDWLLLRFLEAGASGPVYLAEHETEQTRAAVRLLKGPDPEAVLNAARLASGWRHEGAVSVLEVGDDWIAREPSRGVPLARILMAAGRDPGFERRDVATWLMRGLATVADAVSDAHERGLLHLSISPRRIDVGAEGRMRIRDFGFDPVRGGETPGPENPPLASPLFLAPEQAGAGEPGAGESVGPATDIHAFAAVVYNIAAGWPPVNSRSLSDVLRLISEEDVRPVRSCAHWVPEDLAHAIDTSLARTPTARTVSLAELAGLLAELSGPERLQ